MTPLAMLIGGACFVILYRLFGSSSVIALALLLLAAELADEVPAWRWLHHPNYRRRDKRDRRGRFVREGRS